MAPAVMLRDAIPSVNTAYMDTRTKDALRWLAIECPDEGVKSVVLHAEDGHTSWLARVLLEEAAERADAGRWWWTERALRRRARRLGLPRRPSISALCEALQAIAMEWSGWA